MASGRRQAVRLTSLDLCYIRFLDRIIRREAMTEDDAVDLLRGEFSGRPDGDPLLPISRGLLRTVATQVRRGCRRITVWRDEVGKRYVAADPPL